jgi:non-ribosomal peptide synthetase component E (peptide arylation enzyme)
MFFQPAGTVSKEQVMATPPKSTSPAPPPAIGSVKDRQSAMAQRFPTWQARTLDQMLDAAAAEFPTRPYLITDKQTWTYSDIKAWSERLAAGLLAAGVQTGDHVAMLMANHPEFVAVKFAISRVGAVAVPINFLNRRDELGYVLRQSDAVLLVTMDSFRGLDYLGFLDELAPGWATHGGGTRSDNRSKKSHGESSTTPLAPGRVDFRPRPGPTQLAALCRGST